MIIQSAHLRSCLERATRATTVAKTMAQSSCAPAKTTTRLPLHNLLLHDHYYGQRSFHCTSWKNKTEHYYDSQSGKHVPVHDASQVNILLQTPAATTTARQIVACKGISGLVVTKHKDDHESVKALHSAIQQVPNLPDGFELWVKAALVSDNDMKELHPSPPVIVHCFDYHPDDDSAHVETIQDTVSSLVQQQYWTAIACRAGEADALRTAAGVASIIDATAGGDYVHVQGDEGDAMVELAEELAYLDVEGPTLKARMVINLTLLSDMEEAADVVEECLLPGINKYVVEEERLPWLVDLVHEQGKTCNVEVSS